MIMKFKSVINILFLTAMMSSGVFCPVDSVMSSPQIEEAITAGVFKPEPPVQRDGGSRFAEPNTPENQDNIPHVQA